MSLITVRDLRDFASLETGVLGNYYLNLRTIPNPNQEISQQIKFIEQTLRNRDLEERIKVKEIIRRKLDYARKTGNSLSTKRWQDELDNYHMCIS